MEGAEFIGSHLVEKLAKRGYRVIVVDNLLRGKLDNLSSVLDKIKFVKGDIRNYELMEELIKNSEVVFHLASLSRVIPSIENPELCFRINIDGTEIIARLCSKYHKKLIFSSSREVYGTAKYIPVDEDHPLNPENPYGASKVSGEKIIEAYAKNYELSYVILRLTNVYGPRDFDRVTPIFVENAMKGKDLVVYGTDKILDFVYINDVIEAFVRAIDLNENQTLNIGSGMGTSILELAKLINKKIATESESIIVKEKRKGEVDKFVANIERAGRILKWKPKTTLEEGITRTIESYKSMH
ncbi:MAG: GDP-mannose 4,6-dehydratase, partial [Thermoproteota archaeon]